MVNMLYVATSLLGACLKMISFSFRVNWILLSVGSHK
jgi:hypothetical protein